MTKIQTPILTRINDSYNYSHRFGVEVEEESWHFCGFELHEVFDFPECDQIQLVAHDEPGLGRTEIKIVKTKDYFDDILVKGEKDTRIIDEGSMELFKKLAKRRQRWWVTLYYWE